MVDIGAFRFGVATASLGMAASHTLELKLAALQKSGFTCCELGFGEYVAWVRRQCPDLSVTGASLGYNRLMVPAVLHRLVPRNGAKATSRTQATGRFGRR